MIWTSWSEFIDMGGYAFYVWGSYGMALLLIIIEIFALRRRRTQLLQRLSLLARANKSNGSK